MGIVYVSGPYGKREDEAKAMKFGYGNGDDEDWFLVKWQMKARPKRLKTQNWFG